METQYHKYHFLIIAAIIVLFSVFTVYPALSADKDEETYDISLVQTAKINKKLIKLKDKKVLTEAYAAKKGDHIWKILREKKLLKNRNLGEILSVLKKLNPSLSNLDLIHPGQKIIIPLVITPIAGNKETHSMKDIRLASLEKLKNLDLYTVRPGDSLTRVIEDVYTIPPKELYNEYLDQLRKLNPDIKDINRIYPGQKVRLPIYSPKVVRVAIEKGTQTPPPEDKAEREKMMETGRQLGELFTLMGEEWIRTGKQFIPLKTGGQIDLDTESYPIINIRNGRKIILDLYGGLPEKMADLIVSNWGNYRVVDLRNNDTLESAMDKILPACNYDKIFTKDEKLVFDSKISLEINAQWIIRVFPDPAPINENIICIDINGKSGRTIPVSIKRFLNKHGLNFIEYPHGSDNTSKDLKANTKIVNLGENRRSIIGKILDLTGQTFSSGADIPIYQGKDSGFNLVVKADFFFNRQGQDSIIDITGLGKDIIDLLSEHHFKILSLSNKKTLTEMITSTLKFLGVKFDSRKHSFLVNDGNKLNNIKLTIPGILFSDKDNRKNFITPFKLPLEISDFLSTKVDRLLYLGQQSGEKKN